MDRQVHSALTETGCEHTSDSNLSLTELHGDRLLRRLLVVELLVGTTTPDADPRLSSVTTPAKGRFIQSWISSEGPPTGVSSEVSPSDDEHAPRMKATARTGAHRTTVLVEVIRRA